MIDDEIVCALQANCTLHRKYILDSWETHNGKQRAQLRTESRGAGED